jgi:uncharacterized membrane protein YtjA (UPF0391 family)
MTGISTLPRVLPAHKPRNQTRPGRVYPADDALLPRQFMEAVMLGWALTFLVVALIAAVLGFGGIAGAAVGIAKIIFFVAIILFLISAVAGAMRGRAV